jgi:nicotinamidase-related amidase
LKNPAIILVDMLNDFVTGKLQVERTKHIIPNLKRLVEAARDSGVPVIYSTTRITRRKWKSWTSGGTTP